ncbi:hypothetical protein D8674_008556 [Pyrus ussuriensis x Pyrus communis]|uniref:DUF3741 domain-containing protein n=1 Tax=Pyrus ussuriensis x Pyrus communis TaxID=2448454 RepID=A0A5N5HW04_9ROSA|nr:hypothetical protein D8674_008556 [Pyrus ussuriensis x Pyrus communis]
MMRRQDTSLRSASSRRENCPTENLNAKTVGCMSGIFHLFSKHHSSRKFLTFGKRQERNGVGSSSTRSKSSIALIKGSAPAKLAETKHEDKSIYIGRFSSNNVPRSPTLPAEIRRFSSLDSPAENSITPPALVARLMGLEQAPQIMSMMPMQESMSINKRQQLLGALEKCDEDLKALKKIIDSVRAADTLRSPTMVKRMEAAVDDNKKRFYGANFKCVELTSEQPSPVSVLDEFAHSPFSNHHHYRKQVLNYGRAAAQPQLRKRPGEEDFLNPIMIDKITTESVLYKSHNVEAPSTPLWNSKAMVESVAEVCRDIAWGEKREIGRIGLALQDHICKDLIEEMVKDMGSYTCVYSLPFEVCKRRLRF